MTVASIREQFLSPSDEYTPIPFWFWNDQLTKEEIIRQIHDFYDKGVTGFVLHPRIGIPKEIGYLSDAYMKLVQVAVAEANDLGMTVILYDEGMYPSGSANGQVVKKNPEFASRGLKMVEYPCEQGDNTISTVVSSGEQLVSIQAVEKLSESAINFEKTKVIGDQGEQISFSPPNDSEWSILLFIETYTNGTIRGIHFGEDDGEEAAPKSADLLNPDAMKTYIHLTHDNYYSALKEYFGNTVIAMFTDEPDMLGRNSDANLMPWTNDFLAFYIRAGNEESYLPALWFDAESHSLEIRKAYRKTVNEKLTASYYKPISDWCQSHHISLTGHPAASDDIGLLEHFQIPGQDVVWRWVAPEDGKALEGQHTTAGKCSADAARHRGRRRNLNEVLGVCGKESAWALSPGDMKWYFDWLFVRGVNLITPHAFYYSIDGMKRSHERPPDVGPNNSWWPYYKQFAQYIKRMSWLMTDSVNTTEIAVLCEEDHLPCEIVKPLFENQVEFNYLEESLFLNSSRIDKGFLKIKQQKYRVLLMEASKQLDIKVERKLAQFIEDGGKVVSLGDSPLRDAVSISQNDSIIDVLDGIHERQVLLSPQGKDIRVSKLKKNDKVFYVFVNEGEAAYRGTLTVNEEGKVEVWSAWEASIKESESNCVPIFLNRRESLIYCVDPNQKPTIREQTVSAKTGRTIDITSDWSIKNEKLAFSLKRLQSWTEWSGMKHFSGKVTYETTFELNEEDLLSKVSIDLGEVFELAHVFINENDSGVKMWAPYQFEMKSSDLKSGKNTLKVEVTNSIANKMDNLSLKSGLIGPVTIQVKDEV
ncbi:glycosyl hydrolase [Salipaludibacillus sp. CF4.18]|uniref:glycosyl hydrolase n=1 Tax=Salipaludibacillus sp. CF4.18 TaxID=3373081 RepID=UPI003EE57716